MRLLYKPPSDSLMASPNQKYSTVSVARMPMMLTVEPQEASLTQADAPIMVMSREMPASIGQRDGPGTK
ncbi:hypothetical protein D3C85_1560650 [compost metagenome]